MSIGENLANVQGRIAAAARRVGRDPASVRLVTVSKTFSAEAVGDAIAAGAGILGESRVQEAEGKIAAIAAHGGPAVSWHMVGHLQSNKAKIAVRLFDLVHSVDSISLAREIDRQAAAMGKVQGVLIEVNVSGERSKFGVAPEGLSDLIKDLAPFGNIVVEGLMTIPPWSEDPEDSRPYFRRLVGLAQDIERLGVPGVQMKELSMGMSGDFEVAVEEGATLVRVGTAIFGER